MTTKTGRILVLSALFGALWASDVQALSVSPGRTEVRLSPGHKIKALLTVLNDHAEEMQVEVTQKNWFLSEINKDFAARDWLKINGKTYFRLKPGEQREVPITVACPKKAQGVMVGMTSFAYQSMSPGMVTPMISVSVYLTVAGTEKKQGEIKSMAARLWDGKLNVGVEVASTGNVHLRPSGRLQVLDTKGAVVADYQIREGDPVFPGQTRGFIGQGPELKLQPGTYALKAELSAGDIPLHSQKRFIVQPNGDVRMDEKEAVAG